jgi:flagellin FlaB
MRVSKTQGIQPPKTYEKEESMLKRFMKMHRGEKGITGLETAIILIAFVVVASVFAYTVLSAGIFSSQKGKEAIYSGLEEARAAVTLKGSVVAMDTDSNDEVDELVFIVATALEGEAIDFTMPTDTTPVDGIADDGSSNVCVISYSDQTQRVEDLNWSFVPLGKDDGDTLLEPGEKFEITIDLTAMDGDITTYTTFSLEVKPPKGSVLIIERTTPGVVDDVMVLN